MIYKKPQDALHMLDLVVDGGGVMSWVREVRLFLSTLPAEFEIVEPGNVQVRWPDGVTRSELDGWCDDLTRYVPENADILRYLRQLAAIAPVEKKKVRMAAWKYYGIIDLSPVLKPLDWSPEFTDAGWRKVGECEVTE